MVRGDLPRQAALQLALMMMSIAWLAILRLFGGGANSWGLPVGTLATTLVLSWSYSAPPLCLHGRGLGELTVAVVVPVLIPFSGFVAQACEFAWLPLLVSLPLVPLITAMLLTIELADEGAAPPWQPRGCRGQWRWAGFGYSRWPSTSSFGYAVVTGASHRRSEACSSARWYSFCWRWGPTFSR